MEESKQRLLPSQRGSYDSESLESYQTGRTQTIAYRLKKTYPSILAFVLVLSILLNIILFGAYHQAQSKRYLCPSEYTGLGLTTTTKYWQNTEWNDRNRTISDARWESIDTSPGTIGLDKNYAGKHNLAESIPFPWDPSKGLYIVKAFHHMHCLKNIRHAFNEALESHPGQHQLITAEHIHHCLDVLRQDIMCRPDDTPMPSKQERHKIGDGQELKCKDWNALVAWTRDPKRDVCFKTINDYRRMHTLEQFAFCEDESPYKDTMESYFKEHGHRNLYLDDDTDRKEENQ